MNLRKAQLSLCHLIDVQGGQSEISSCTGHTSHVGDHESSLKSVGTPCVHSAQSSDCCQT